MLEVNRRWVALVENEDHKIYWDSDEAKNFINEMATHTQKKKENFIMDNWYVLSVWTGKEHYCVERMRFYNSEKAVNNISAFVPTRETFFKKNGNVNKKIEDYCINLF